MRKLTLLAALLMLPNLAFGQLTSATSNPFTISAMVVSSQSLLPYFEGQWWDNNGNPLASGRVCTTVSSTTTNQATYPTYADAVALTNPNSNPVVLDSAGRANIWLKAGVFYRIALYANGTGNTCNGSAVGTLIKAVDGVAAAGGGGGGGSGCVGPGTLNFLTKWTSTTECGDSQILEDLGAGFLKARLGTAGDSGETGEFWLTVDSTGDATPFGQVDILFATKTGSASDVEFAGIQATGSTDAMGYITTTFKIGNFQGDDRLLNYSFDDLTNVEFLELADESIVYNSASAHYKIFMNWNTSVQGDTQARGALKIGASDGSPSGYFPGSNNGAALLAGRGVPIEPLPGTGLTDGNDEFNYASCVGQFGAGDDGTCSLIVWNGDQRVSNPNVNESQVLAESDFATNTKWTANNISGTSTFAFSGQKAVFTNTSGSGNSNITQAMADLLTPGLGDRYYFFAYTISSKTGTPECYLQSPGWDVGVGSPRHLMDVTNGVHGFSGMLPAFYFRSVGTNYYVIPDPGNPVDFVISCEATGAATVSFDDLYVAPALGGSLTVDGDTTTNGRLKQGMGGPIDTGGDQCYMGACLIPGWADSNIGTYMGSAHCINLTSNDCRGGNFFLLRGTTTVDCFATGGWNPGNRVLFKTDGNLTLSNNAMCATWPGGGGGTGRYLFGPMRLLGGANVSMTANDMIELVLDDVYEWNQVAPVLVK